MIQGIDVVFLHVRDPTEMAKWYQEMLGVKIGFQTSDLHWQEFDFSSDRPPTRFGLDAIGEGATHVESQKIMISFAVTELKRFVADCESKGIRFVGTPKIVDVGPTLFATTQDPEGNWIQFSERK